MLMKQLIFSFEMGLASRIPLCCVLRYCYDLLRGRLPAHHRNTAYRLDIRFDETGGHRCIAYVPCMIFHTAPYTAQDPRVSARRVIDLENEVKT